MNLDAVRADLRAARDQLVSGDTATAVATLDRALEDLAPEPMLTPEEAAVELGIESTLPVWIWCKRDLMRCQRDGDCLRIPMSEVQRFAPSDDVRMMQIADRLHAETAELGGEGMTDEEMEALHRSRPGTLPWERGNNGATDG